MRSVQFGQMYTIGGAKTDEQAERLVRALEEKGKQTDVPVVATFDRQGIPLMTGRHINVFTAEDAELGREVDQAYQNMHTAQSIQILSQWLALRFERAKAGQSKSIAHAGKVLGWLKADRFDVKTGSHVSLLDHWLRKLRNRV